MITIPAIPVGPAHREFAVPRRHSLVLSGGIAGVSRVTAALLAFGCRVGDFTAEVREGVGLSGLTCTVSATATQAARLADRLRAEPDVVTVDVG